MQSPGFSAKTARHHGLNSPLGRVTTRYSLVLSFQSAGKCTFETCCSNISYKTRSRTNYKKTWTGDELWQSPTLQRHCNYKIVINSPRFSLLLLSWFGRGSKRTWNIHLFHQEGTWEFSRLHRDNCIFKLSPGKYTWRRSPNRTYFINMNRMRSNSLKARNNKRCLGDRRSTLLCLYRVSNWRQWIKIVISMLIRPPNTPIYCVKILILTYPSCVGL